MDASVKLSVALVGAGRMGAFLGSQLPSDVTKIVIDLDGQKARKLADTIGAAWSASLDAAEQADVIPIVLPAKAVDPVAASLAAIAKSGAIIMNMATEGVMSEKTRAMNPKLHFVDAKIIGHAKSMSQGAQGCVVTDTKDPDVLEKIKYCLPGYGKVFTGDSSLVPIINKIGSGEGIRTAVKIRRLLKQYNIPKEWEDIVIYTVCAGTMRAYVENDLGEFGIKLAEELEVEYSSTPSKGQ